MPAEDENPARRVRSSPERTLADQLLSTDPRTPAGPTPTGRASGGKRANDLDGAEWTRSSISVWSDVRKTPEETALKHPAMFPAMLVERLIRCLTREGARTILDPFCGSGSTLLAARNQGGRGIGFEVAPDYRELARQRLLAAGAEAGRDYELHAASVSAIPDLLPAETVDLCVTSPPYWDILSRKRTADYKETRDYAVGGDDLSRVEDYEEFVSRLKDAFWKVCEALKPGAYCVINVMDLRKKATFYPLHSDLATALTDPARGGPFLYDDLIVWDRRAEYNNLRPLGYPAVFRINKVHEFLLILQKPRSPPEPRPKRTA